MNLTRADLYKSVGGGWRTARKRHPCYRIASCGNVIQAGEEYFDTNAPDQGSRSAYSKLKLCAECARQEIK